MAVFSGRRQLHRWIARGGRARSPVGSIAVAFGPFQWMTYGNHNPHVLRTATGTMFTGIVELTGEVRGVMDAEGGRRLRIEANVGDLEHGRSVSVNGACLTVEEAGEGWFEVFLAHETIARTALGEIAEGDPVNIERALPADGRFDGHVVQGHVDATADILAVSRVGADWRFAFSLPASIARYVVEKGSIAVDGISLTVAKRDEESFSVAIIPTTYGETNLSAKAVGDPVHLEVDVIAKYVERMLDGYEPGTA